MRPIVIGTISLDGMAGGLEKNIVLLANHLCSSGRSVRLVTFDNAEASSFYELDNRVEWFKVGRTKPHSKIGFVDRLMLIGRIRSVLKKERDPIVICFHHGTLPRFHFAGLMLKRSMICSERNSLDLYSYIRQSKKSLGYLMLAMVDRITVQFDRYIYDYPRMYRSKIQVIPNPVSPARALATPDVPNAAGRFKLLAIGRLCTQKNYYLLINAFSEIANEYKNWDLHILGDGSLEDELRAHVCQSSLGGRVFLEGKCRNIPDWLVAAHLFCMPSQWEGFPNALAEAMAHGLPCIGLLSCAGVRDLIFDDVSGRLVEKSQLANAFRELMEDHGRRAAMGKSSSNIISKYRPEIALRGWDNLLSELEGVQ